VKGISLVEAGISLSFDEAKRHHCLSVKIVDFRCAGWYNAVLQKKDYSAHFSARGKI